MLRPGQIVVEPTGIIRVVESSHERRDCYRCWLRFHPGVNKFFYRNDKENVKTRVLSELEVQLFRNEDYDPLFVVELRRIL
jgi:hypothetical protein